MYIYMHAGFWGDVFSLDLHQMIVRIQFSALDLETDSFSMKLLSERRNRALQSLNVRYHCFIIWHYRSIHMYKVGITIVP